MITCRYNKINKSPIKNCCHESVKSIRTYEDDLADDTQPQVDDQVTLLPNDIEKLDATADELIGKNSDTSSQATSDTQCVSFDVPADKVDVINTIVSALGGTPCTDADNQDDSSLDEQTECDLFDNRIH